MSDTRDYQGQRWLMDCMNNLGYDFDERGKCFGLAHMGIQAIQSGEAGINEYMKRISQIHDIYFPLSVEAKKQVLSEFNVAIPKDVRSEDFKLRDIKDNNFRQRIINRIQDLFKDSVKRKTNRELNIFDLYAFFDGIELYQRPRVYRELWRKPAEINSQNAIRSQSLAMSAAMENRGGLAEVDIFSGSYSDTELEKYIETLAQSLLGVNYPVSLKLSSISHAISVNYVPPNKLDENPHWIFIDANKLPPKEIKITNARELAIYIKNAFCFDKNAPTSRATILETIVYSTNNNKVDLQKRIDNWHREKSMKEMHKVTKEKIFSASNINYSWMEVAAHFKQDIFEKSKVRDLFAANPRGYYLLKQNKSITKTISQDEIEKMISHNELDIHRTYHIGYTLVHLAVLFDDYKLLNALLHHADKINFKGKDENGQTALHIAVNMNNKLMINGLIKNCPELLFEKDNHGKSVWDDAEVKMTDFMMKHIKLNDLHRIFLHITAYESSSLALQFIKRFPMLVSGDQGVEALIVAAKHGRADMVQLLLDQKISPVIKLSGTNETALDAAAAAGDVKTLQILANKIIKSDRQFLTALSIFSDSNKTENKREVKSDAPEKKSEQDDKLNPSR